MRKFRIMIDRQLCVGDGLCCELAPETFAKDDEGNIVVTVPHGDPPEYVLRAARHCQMDAITVCDAETGRKLWPVD